VIDKIDRAMVIKGVFSEPMLTKTQKDNSNNSNNPRAMLTIISTACQSPMVSGERLLNFRTPRIPDHKDEVERLLNFQCSKDDGLSTDMSLPLYLPVCARHLCLLT
jgi:hypothetical protein